MDRTLVLIKPDGVQRGLMGEVITRLEQRGLRLVGAKFMQVSQELAAVQECLFVPFAIGDDVTLRWAAIAIAKPGIHARVLVVGRAGRPTVWAET